MNTTAPIAWFAAKVQLSDIDVGPLARNGKPRLHATVTIQGVTTRITVTKPAMIETLTAVGNLGFAVLRGQRFESKCPAKNPFFFIVTAKKANVAERPTNIPAVARTA